MAHKKRQDDYIWFSKFFGIELPQYQIPFVDFDLEADVPLYVDPYAITKDPSDLGAECHNTILSYFETLLAAIRVNNQIAIRNLIRGRLSEPTEIYLGVGKRARGGRGIGLIQEQQLIEAMTASKAIQVGYIQAIQELELHIEGIGADKISDLIANIILAHLARFTGEMCNVYGIASRPVAVNGFWNEEQARWDGDFFTLPTDGTHAFILVPRRFVRREQDLMNHRIFYEKYVLDILQRELLNADDSLVETLKNGNRRVTKKSIKDDERFELSKPNISEFIVNHPDSIDEYRTDLQEDFCPVDPAIFSGKFAEDDPQIQANLDTLTNVLAGKKAANQYHNIVYELLQFIFDWGLENFEKEYKTDHGLGRIDIIADNIAGGGILREMRQEFHATSVPIECKNYSTDLGNAEFNQLSDRLSVTTSMFGILFCRTITDAAAMRKHQTTRWLRQQKIMLLIDDVGLRSLVELRLVRHFDGIQSSLRRMIRDVRYGGNNRLQ